MSQEVEQTLKDKYDVYSVLPVAERRGFLIGYNLREEKLQEQAKEIEYQQQVMKEEIERLKSLLKECKVLIHQEMFMDDDYDGVWRDEPETIVKNINKLLTNKKI
jgi:hypothetical protein